MEEIQPEDSPLAKLASKGPAPDWIYDELKPYTEVDLLKDLYDLAKLEEGE